ncbi:hypothetical protein A7M65_19460 [Acinetobacter baumannii]|nr:hypothetical protein A7M65_19460 [Acinetobacter baumannii]
MAPDEVFLGDECPVTSVYQRFYEFDYHPTDCNIRTEVLPEDRLLFISKIIFKSKFSDLEASMPVACVVPRHPAPKKRILRNNANKQGGPLKRSGIPHLHFGKTITWEVQNYLDVQFYPLKYHTVHLSPPENSEDDSNLYNATAR